MPKGKKKMRKKGPQDRDAGESNDDYDTADNMSVISNVSEAKSFMDDEPGQNGEVDELSIQLEFEEKIKTSIEGTSEKSSKTREISLKSLSSVMASKYICEFLDNRYLTVCDSLERCIKKGKGLEQMLAANCFSLLCVQLGTGSNGEQAYVQLKPIMQTILLDNTASNKARAACAEALGLCSFVSSSEIDQVVSIMQALETVFKGSYLKGDGSSPITNPDVSALHTAALSAWCLLVSISPGSYVDRYIETVLPKLPGLLLSSDVDLRIVAGETIALLYELARESDEDFVGTNEDELCECLKSLSKDSNKYRAKKDRKVQRSSFREILRAIEEGEAPDLTIKFGEEVLYIDSWTRRKQYDAICHILGSGMNIHLQENELVRDIFGMGPPMPSMKGDVKKNRSSRNERHMYNAAAFKARTKARTKLRDKRTAQLSF